MRLREWVVGLAMAGYGAWTVGTVVGMLAQHLMHALIR